MLLEIRKLIPNIANLKKSKVDSVNIGKKTYSYQSNNNTSSAQEKVRECDENIDRLNRKKNELIQEKSRNDAKKLNYNMQISSLRSNINNINNRISGLGRRPDVEYSYKMKEVRGEKRSWLNPKRWFGDKYETKKVYEEVRDYSKQNEYDRKRSQLNSEKMSLDRQLSSIQQQINKLPNMEFELQSIARNIERQLQEKEYQLNEIRKEEETQKKQMAAGREAFLNSRKTALISMIRSIIANEQSDLYRSLKSDSMKCLSELRYDLLENIRIHFNKESSKYIERLNVMLNNVSSVIENKEIQQKRDVLKTNKKNVSVLLSEVKDLII